MNFLEPLVIQTCRLQVLRPLGLVFVFELNINKIYWFSIINILMVPLLRYRCPLYDMQQAIILCTVPSNVMFGFIPSRFPHNTILRALTTKFYQSDAPAFIYVIKPYNESTNHEWSGWNYQTCTD